MPVLRMLRGPEPGKEFVLEGDTVTIGRGIKNEVIIRDNQVSREHCRLVKVLYDYEIYDLGSTNGTFLNGRQLDGNPTPLVAPYKIELGETILLEYVPSTLSPSAPTTNFLQSVEVAPAALYLVVRTLNKEQPDVYLLDSPSIALGRHVENDIVLSEKEVSRQHLRLDQHGEGYVLQDMDTSNGTFLNGNRVSKAYLRRGDYIRIGTSVEMWYTDDLENLRLEPVEMLFSDSDFEQDNTLRRPITRPTRAVKDIPTPEDGAQPYKTDELRGYAFIAYAREDWQVVEPLYRYLRGKGALPWVDQKYALGNEKWTKAVEQARLECACLVMVVSERSIQAPHVRGSLQYFLSREKPIIFLQIEELDRLPLALQSKSIVPLDEGQPLNTYQAILEEIERIKNGS